MNRLKNWCIETVQKAVSGLINKEEKHEELSYMIIQSEGTYEATKNGHSRSSSSQKYLCKVCKSPCVYCVSLKGSSVDKRSNYNGASMSTDNSILSWKATAEVSVQTEPLTGLSHSTNDLPDLLVSSALSRISLNLASLPPRPPPLPPPPPPPLPSKFITTSIINTRKRQIVLKKSQSAGMSAGPKITVELLKNVKLRKLMDDKDISQSHQENSLKDGILCAQPAVTLELLQKVTLRKTQMTKHAFGGSPSTKTETIGDTGIGTESRTNIHRNLRKTHLTRSPGGTPKQLKRKKQPPKEHHSVLCKQRLQSPVKSKSLL